MNGTVEYNFEPFKQGTDWIRTLTFKTNGSAENLTNYTAHMTIRDEPHNAGTVLLDLTTTPNANGSGIAITGATGVVTITISDIDTDSFTWETGYYDLKLISPSGSGYLESVPIFGTITVIPKVTD